MTNVFLLEQRGEDSFFLAEARSSTLDDTIPLVKNIRNDILIERRPGQVVAIIIIICNNIDEYYRLAL